MKISTLHKIIKNRLNAGALLYTILIAFIILISLNLYILSLYYNDMKINRIIISDRLHSNIVSAINLEMIIQKNNEFELQKIINLYNDNESDVLLINNQFGFFQIITGIASWQNIFKSKTALIGEDLSSEAPFGIYLTDKNNELVLCGKSDISGTCFLPRLGVRAGAINNQNYQNNTLINGQIFKSNKQLPQFNENILLYISDYQSGVFGINDSIIEYENIGQDIYIQNSFEKKTLVIFSEEPIILENIVIKGNIILISTKYIIVNELTKIDDAIILSPFINITSNHSSNCQFIAKDSIIVEKGVKLNYPTVVAVINLDVFAGNTTIEIKENSDILGSVILFRKVNSNTAISKISFEKNTNIMGHIYCNGHLELNSDIYGSIYTDNFYLKSNTSVYEDYLLDITVDPYKMKEDFARSLFLSETKRKKIVKWLN